MNSVASIMNESHTAMIALDVIERFLLKVEKDNDQNWDNN